MRKFLKSPPVKLMRHLMLALFLLLMLAAVVIMPHALSLRIGALLGKAACFLAGGYRRRADDNIRTAIPGLSPLEVRRVRTESFANMGMNLAEFALLGFRSRKFWSRRVKIDGAENLRRNAGKKGVIYLTAHIGNWELMGAFFTMMGLSVNVVARRITDSRLDWMLVAVRKRRGVNTIYRKGRANTKKMIAALKRKEILGVLIDQDTKVGGVFVDFFGRPAYTPTACSQFARIKDTVVIPGFIAREKALSHRITVMEPVSGGSDPQSETQEYTRIIENFIREHPSQWVWMHPRWKRKPA